MVSKSTADHCGELKLSQGFFVNMPISNLLLRVTRVGKVINKRDKHEDFKEAGGIPSVHVSYISYQVSGDPSAPFDSC